MYLLSRCAVSFETLESRRLLCGTPAAAKSVATGVATAQQLAVLAAAPASFAGLQLNATITTGTSPLLLGTTYQFVSAAGGTYFLIGPTGLTLSDGSYTYSTPTPTTATLTFSNSVVAGTFTINLTFDSTTSGTFTATDSITLTQNSGTFTISPAPNGVISSDVLNISGTVGDDAMSVDLVNGLVRVTVNQKTEVFAQNIMHSLSVISVEGNDTINIDASIIIPAYVNAGVGDDTIIGGSGNDTLTGGAGLDVIDGKLGNDRINGYSGKDNIIGGGGDDRLYGMAANDVIQGGSGVDRIFGGTENDVLIGNGSNDKIYGEEGIDVLYGNDGDDILDGGADGDEIFSGAGNNTINGGTGNDTIQTDYGTSNVIFGDDGDDTIFCRNNAYDVLDGGLGIDSAKIDGIDSRTGIETLLP